MYLIFRQVKSARRAVFLSLTYPPVYSNRHIPHMITPLSLFFSAALYADCFFSAVRSSHCLPPFFESVNLSLRLIFIISTPPCGVNENLTEKYTHWCRTQSGKHRSFPIPSQSSKITALAPGDTTASPRSLIMCVMPGFPVIITVQI